MAGRVVVPCRQRAWMRRIGGGSIGTNLIDGGECSRPSRGITAAPRPAATGASWVACSGRHSTMICYEGASGPRHGMSAPDRRVLIFQTRIDPQWTWTPAKARRGPSRWSCWCTWRCDLARPMRERLPIIGWRLDQQVDRDRSDVLAAGARRVGVTDPVALAVVRVAFDLAVAGAACWVVPVVAAGGTRATCGTVTVASTPSRTAQRDVTAQDPPCGAGGGDAAASD